MKILFVLFKTLGDVCMGTTVVRALKTKYPDSTIDFVTMPQNKNILEGNPDINKIILLDNYMDANLYFIENEYDEIYRVGMSNWIDTCWHHVPEHQNQHLVEWYAKRAGIEQLDDKNIYIYLTDDDKDAVSDYWEDLPKDKKIVALHTTSGAHPGVGPIESKDWPIQRFHELATRLVADGYTVVQLGAFSDKKIKTPGVFDLTGKFSFKQNAEAIKRCAGYIGVDSGPAYLAGWSGVPTVLIMGATQNEKDVKGAISYGSDGQPINRPDLMSNGPWVGPREDNVVYINAPKPMHQACQPVPCYVRCQIGKEGGCISDISVDQVYEKFKSKLDEKV